MDSAAPRETPQQDRAAPRIVELPSVRADGRCSGCGARVRADGKCACDPREYVRPVTEQDRAAQEPPDPVDELAAVIAQTLGANALILTTSRGGYVGGGQPHATLDSDPGAIEAVARGLLARRVTGPSDD